LSWFSLLKIKPQSKHFTVYIILDIINIISLTHKYIIQLKEIILIILMEKEDILEDYNLLVRSVSTNTLKTLFEVLKEVLVRNVNIVFDTDTIKITEMDGTKNVLVSLSLTAESFQLYHCPEKLILGINPSNVFKIIKIVTNNDTITFAVRKDDPENFLIRLQNNDKNKFFESSVKLLDKKYQEINIPPSEFDTEVCMLSTEFQNIIKNINSLGHEVHTLEISSVNGKFMFKHKGDFSDQKIIFDNSEETNIDITENNIVQGYFNIKFLLLFTKATKLSQYLKIYMKNNFPLVLEYTVGNLGFLRFILAQSK
jgi:proliferating cell nuclear antigen